MPINNQKIPLVESLNKFVSGKNEDFSQLQGKSLPATIDSIEGNSTIATVNIELRSQYQLPKIRVPIATSEYYRAPFKAGDKGFVVSADTYMGGMSGIGGGTATLDQLPNLATLIWIPCGNVDNSGLPFPGMPWVNGPNGVYLSDTSKTIELILDKQDGLIIKWKGETLMTVNNGGIQLQFQGKGIEISSAGTHIDGINFLPHGHSNIQAGSDVSGPVFDP